MLHRVIITIIIIVIIIPHIIIIHGLQPSPLLEQQAYQYSTLFVS
jgi:hypothetical protein